MLKNLSKEEVAEKKTFFLKVAIAGETEAMSLSPGFISKEMMHSAGHYGDLAVRCGKIEYLLGVIDRLGTNWTESPLSWFACKFLKLEIAWLARPIDFD